MAIETLDSEDYQWNEGSAYAVTDKSPGSFAFVTFAPGGALLKLHRGISEMHVGSWVYPVPVLWASHLVTAYTLTNLNSVALWDNYDMEQTPLMIAGQINVNLNATDWPGTLENGGMTMHLYIKEDLSEAFMSLGDIDLLGNTDGLATDLAAANPGGFATGQLTITWSVNNG